MIKKLFIIVVMLSLIACFAAPAFCDDGPVTKLGRGIANMLTFPLEIPSQISRVNAVDGPVAAGTVGVLKGIGWALGRAGVGVYETATFMFPGHRNYKPVLTDPEYFLESSNL